MAGGEVQAISEFLDRYKEFNQAQVKEFKFEFNALKKSFEKIHKEAVKEAMVYAPAFNVFSILGLSRNEARTHSAMIAELLTPTGAHGQGCLFLKDFLQMCANKDEEFPLPVEDVSHGRWFLSTEQVFSHGRMDIVLRCPDLNCLYVIENKIDAIEQEEQLLRYHQWITEREKYYPINALLFLTIEGGPSISAHGVRYFPLSYQNDIKNWLLRVLPEVEASNVREVVNQYLDLVRRL